MELVQQGKVEYMRISFLIAGHTKFSPDLLFSKIAKSYNSWDVFTTNELQNDVVGLYADVTVDDGNLVLAWREAVVSKYSKFPGIRSLHDFLFMKNSVTGRVTAKTRSLCYTGSSMQILHGRDTDNIIPNESQSYSSLNKTRSLSKSKVEHLKQMYRDFIPLERHLPFLSEYWTAADTYAHFCSLYTLPYHHLYTSLIITTV